jgi:hypothetical protein
MAVAFVGLEHVDVERLAQRLGNAEFEEFTAAILLDIHGVIVRHTLRGHDANFEARAHHGEFRFNVIRIHTFFGCGPARVGRNTRVSRGAGRIRITRFGL